MEAAQNSSEVEAEARVEGQMTAFVELFAGSAAVSFRLFGDCAPPSGYLGGKQKYARAVLHALDIHRDDVEVVQADAFDVWPELPPRSVVYLDPPYRGATGYGALPPSAEAVAGLCRRLVGAGHRVALSYGEPLDIGPGTVVVEPERVGWQQQSFGRQREYIMTAGAQ